VKTTPARTIWMTRIRKLSIWAMNLVNPADVQLQY